MAIVCRGIFFGLLDLRHVLGIVRTCPCHFRLTMAFVGNMHGAVLLCLQASSFFVEPLTLKFPRFEQRFLFPKMKDLSVAGIPQGPRKHLIHFVGASRLDLPV